MKVYVPIRHIKAALLMAAKDDVRFYLNGLLIEANAERTLIVATNGHVMSASCSGCENECDDVRVIVPREACILATKFPAKTVHGDDEFNLPLTCESGRWQLGDVRFEPIGGSFPDWRATIKTYGEPTSTEPGQFNAEYLALFHKASKALGGKGYIHVYHNGPEKAALIRLESVPDSYVGLVMPLRSECGAFTLPKWASAA